MSGIGRLEMLAAALSDTGADVVGLQETKCGSGLTNCIRGEYTFYATPTMNARGVGVGIRSSKMGMMDGGK